MLHLRPYKPCDAEKIVSWCQNEAVFHKWGGDHFGAYPITAGTMNAVYFEKNGNCTEADNAPVHFCYTSLGFRKIETVDNVIEMELSLS